MSFYKIVILAYIFVTASSLSLNNNEFRGKQRGSSCAAKEEGIVSVVPMVDDSIRKKEEGVVSSRRVLLSRMGTSASSLMIGVPLVLSSLPTVSNASPPMTAGESDNLGARAGRAFRTKPPKILRQRLNQDFAVLLMRSSYNALDQLDCVPMDQFQRDFFFIRSSEYQYYVNELGPGVVTQGELSDPYYFDFISFAQYATIARDTTGELPLVLEEQQPDGNKEGSEIQKFSPKVIRRSPDLIDNSLLPIRHGEIVGILIVDRLNEIFGNTTSAIPVIEEGSRPNANILLTSLQQMTNLFVINGFAWDGKASITKQKQSSTTTTETEFTIKLSSPATLWSGQALKQRKTKTTNDFLMKAAKVIVKRAGYKVISSSTEYSNNQEINKFTIA